MKVTLGIDIGGTNTVFGFVEEKSTHCRWTDQIETASYKTAQQLFKAIFEQVKEALHNRDDLNLVGIGVGAPNGNYYTGSVEKAPNLPWQNANIVQIVNSFFDLPVAITNDANAAAIAEMKFGAAKGMRDFIEITLGTGLGSGIVVNGKMVYGSDGFAGELGHTIVHEDGRLCNCGRKGCLETYVSANGLKRTLMELIASENMNSPLTQIPYEKITARQIYEEAKGGDRLALEVFEVTGKILGIALANAAACLSPEAIILYGGLVAAGDLLLQPTRKYFEKNLLNIFQGKVKIIASALDLNEAAILGAGALIWTEINNGKTE